VNEADRELLLALADDEHLMGQQHTEWIGVAPFLEEDLAFASIGQDELGHAALLYEVLASETDVDALAFGRDPSDYRSCWLVEAPCTDWSDAIVRQWLYDEAEVLRWQALASSGADDVRAIAQRALSEEVYHRRHAAALLDALAGDDAANGRLRAAFERLGPLAHAVFDGCEALRGPWLAKVSARFGEPPAEPSPDQRGRTRRSEHFDPLYSRMREVFVLDPTATW
jgi:ring-1,2-phenylacetyl-CoA epoxidase subunit PaaC